MLLDSDDDRETTGAAAGPRKPVQQRDRWSVRTAKVLVNICTPPTGAKAISSSPVRTGSFILLLIAPRLHATRTASIRRRHPRTAPRPPVSALEDATPRAEQFSQVGADVASRVASHGRESRHSSATSACRSVRRSVNPSATEEIAGQSASSLRPATAATTGQLNPQPSTHRRSFTAASDVSTTQIASSRPKPSRSTRRRASAAGPIAAFIVTFHESRHAGHPLIKPVVPAVRGLIVTYLKARRAVTR